MTRPRTGHLAFPSSLVKEHTAHLPMYSAQPKALHCPLGRLSALVRSLTVEEGKAMFAILPMADLQVDAWGYMVK